jgi:hypothetical protein
MVFTLRALKTFTGRPGESRKPADLVEMGSDFNVTDKRRAEYLERKGFAVPLMKPRAKAEVVPSNKMEPPLQNKAAGDGPLPLTGGETGPQSGSVSSSAPDQAPSRRGSRRRGGERES